MKKFLKKYNIYFIFGLIIFVMLSTVYFIKGIFPFGKFSLIWSDLHEQITSFYYHFYDSIRGNQSLFIDFKTGLGINFFGTFGYYLSNIFSFLILLFPRNLIYLAISIIVLLKFIFCGETALYAFKTLFPKLSKFKLILLSLLYAFSGYTLSYYVITGWIDVVALFPLLIISLKKLLDDHSYKMYLIVLTISIISNFYLSFITLFFVLFASLIYTILYQEKCVRKKSLTLLGIITLISILLSSVLLLPTIIQILNSSRSGFDLSSILNSGLGPITDKVSIFFLSAFQIVTIILLLLLRDLKKHKKFSKLIISILVILLLPVIVEGINKLWHLGSYSFFPLRFGFIPIFILLIGSAYYLNVKEEEKTNSKTKNIICIIVTAISSLLLILISLYKYNNIQLAIDSLTLSSNKVVALLLLVMFVIVFFSILFILWELGKNSRLGLTLISIILFIHTMVNLFFYLGIDYDMKRLNLDYESMQILSKDYNNDIYRVKNMNYNLFSNFGNVSLYQTSSHFTSLTRKSTIEILQKLGYSSIWTKQLSNSGSLFSDALLANKYILSEEEINVPYYSLDKTYNNRNFYKSNLDISFGYLINSNQSLNGVNNVFDASNIIYKSIVGEGDLFTIYDSFDRQENILSQNIYVRNKQYLYLDVKKLNNNKIFNSLKVSVNGKELRTTYPTKEENGLLELGIFENENVKIEIILLNNNLIDSILVGGLDIQLFEDFVKNEKINTSVNFYKNKVLINLDSEEENILFLPIAYDEGFTAYNNDKEIKVEKIYDGFIGIKLTKGTNNIILKFIPKGLKLGGLVSIITLIFALLFNKLKEKILNCTIITNFIYIIYISLSIILLFIMYFVPLITFII